MGRFPEFRPTTAVVTGAASGIGHLEVQRLRTSGVRVIGGDRNPAIETMHDEDPGYFGLAGDITDPSYATALLDLATHRFGPVDLVFHAAGIMPGGKIADNDTDTILQVMSVNYAGTVHIVKAALPLMRERGRGRIIVLGSLTGYVPTVGFASYSASKAAVNTFVETLAHEEAQHGIQVLLAAPNAVKTPLLNQVTGGPKLIANLHRKEKSPLMMTPAKVLNDIDRAIRREQKVVVPGGSAIHLIRKIAPNLLWRIDALLNR